MDDQRFEKLTQRQRHYLRLVLVRHNSAEIARVERQRGVEVSKVAIDKVIKQAMERVGTNSRFEAARQFAEFEARQGVQRLDPKPEDLSGSAAIEPYPEPSLERDEAGGGDNELVFHDVGATYRPVPDGDQTLAPPLPRPRDNDISGVMWGRLWRSLLITLGLVLAAIALGNVYAELSH
jgi:hypothetical protein